MIFKFPALIVVSLAVVVAEKEQKEKEQKQLPKVQVGIKKRVENCTERSAYGDLIHIEYTAKLHETGVEFDTSKSMHKPFVFALGRETRVIEGWHHGLCNMCVGEKRKLVIPPHLAYGEQGAPPVIPAGSLLDFDVELVKLEKNKGVVPEPHMDGWKGKDGYKSYSELYWDEGRFKVRELKLPDADSGPGKTVYDDHGRLTKVYDNEEL